MPEASAMTQIEEELPSAEDLMPLTQTLITPTLAFIFRIGQHSKISPAQEEDEPRFLELGNPRFGTSAQIEEDGVEVKAGSKDDQIQGRKSGGSKRTMSPSEELENMSCSNENENENENESEGARTLKRPRLVWTPQLHKRFVDAVHHLGVKNAVPKTIMQLMNVDGLTRENVASHLQKYRLYLKRLHQGLSTTPPTSPFLPVPTISAFNKDSFLPFIVPTLPHFQFQASAAQPHPFSPPVRSSQNSSAYDQGPSQRQLLNFLSTKGH